MPSKKKILVIGTGGTIAAVQTEEGLRPAYKTEELISFFPEVKQIADIEGKQLFNLDSTNMQPHHWSEIAKEIEKQYEKYDGFVITHGTGTMQYTAAALSFMLQNLGKTVVLTGSVKAIGEVDMTLYEVGQKAMKAGAIPCNDMTSETAIVKLMWIMGNFGKDNKTIKELMMKNFVGEIRVK